MKLKLVIFISFLSFIHLSAFSLGSKIVYLEKLQKEASQLKEDGYYDQSIEISKKIKEHSLRYKDLFSTVKKWYQLERRLKVAKQIGADQHAPKEFNEAVDLFKKAEINILDEDYPTANDNIDEGMRLAEIAIQKTKIYFVALKNSEKKKSSIPLADVEVVKLNGYYVVRLIPNRRDCLWRIAEYENIYSDPWKWRLIYNANRKIIDDPNLIYPHQRLIIPPEPVDFDEQ